MVQRQRVLDLAEGKRDLLSSVEVDPFPCQVLSQIVLLPSICWCYKADCYHHAWLVKNRGKVQNCLMSGEGSIALNRSLGSLVCSWRQLTSVSRLRSQIGFSNRDCPQTEGALHD